ncbi:DUF2934 domain-containing protein [Pararobbsia alpina]|jgi:hypothetical protein|uniref:DUF2934 domain-containing protein n=1 Tax=Pararobbsia alpina TaxID=621374 RepID=UPI0039A72347
MTDRKAAAIEQRIRERAYHLWERDHAPGKDANDYWDAARRQLAAEGSSMNLVSDDLADVQQSDKRRLETRDPQDDGQAPNVHIDAPRAKRAH